jgi:hypothetical protein
MKRTTLLLTALLCSTLTVSLFTACNSDDDNSPRTVNTNRADSKTDDGEAVGEQRAIFQAHVSKNLKQLAQELNIAPWQAANLVNSNFNSAVLAQPDFMSTFQQQLLQSVKQTLQPASDELAADGFKYQGTVALTTLLDWLAQQCEDPLITFTPQGDLTPVLAQHLSNDTVAVILLIPSQLQFSISSALHGEQAELFKGTLQLASTAQGINANPLIDTWSLSGTVYATIPATSGEVDAATLQFTISQDGTNNKSTNKMAFVHNGKKMIELDATHTQENGLSVLPQFSDDASLLDMVYSFVSGKKIDSLKLTLLDDMTITLSISDCAAATRIWQEAKTARRGYASFSAIDPFTQQLNQLITASVSCKDIDQQLPVMLVTTQLGFDHLALPALKFADENYYAPLTSLIDQPTMLYAINIVDHCLDPAQQTIIALRQFSRFMQALLNPEATE